MSLRAARLEDAATIAAIHRSAAFVPVVHTLDEMVAFTRERLMAENQVWVVQEDQRVVAYIAFNDDWVMHLFVHPEHQGRGHGPALLEHATSDGRARQLWTFQKNLRARKFYEDRGWVAVELTDGQGNEEKEPDVRYVWTP